ncbi:hypothetical protein IWZ01DRAFT_488027 [Phyllosticta capitalensis]
MSAFGDTLRPFPLNGNMQAWEDQEETEINEAVDAENFAEVARLTEQALLDPRLPLPRRVRYESLLACLPDRNPWTHLKNAEHALRIIEEYLEMDENPAQQNLDFVKDQHLFIDDLKNDIRTEGDWPEESEIDNAVDKHKPNKRGRESDGEKEERDVKKSKFVEDDSVA